jgi:hypothetical protein
MATLAQLAQQYLNQGLPSISGIFQPRVNTPVEEPVEETIPGITPLFLQQMGGDNFNVYNPDPTRLRTSDQYSPFNARRFYARPDSDVGIPSGILSDSKFLYGDRVQLPGILGAAQNFIGNKLPVNRRAILENETLGAGIALDDIGRIVQGSGDYNTAENVMAGYNLAKITPETIQKRRDMINKNMKDPEQKAARLKALDDFENKMFGTGGITDLSDGIFDQKTRAKGDIPLTDQIAMNQAKLNFQKLANSDDDDDDFDITSILDPTSKKNIIKNKEKITNQIFQKAINDVKQKEIAKQKQIEKTQKANIPATPGFDVSGGAGGTYDRGRDYSGASDRTAGDRARTRDSRKSDLGFSDIRLKENVELIGKSPSNINIYKFNYKNNPTTYQGAMAHEVPWASVKHSNGYMMIDYNQIDVEFKKWQR